MKILGISGKKSSGKNACANFILGVFLVHHGVVRGNFHINKEGLLEVSDIFGNEANAGIINQDCYSSPDIAEFWYSNVFPHCKIYSFASLLKRNICMEILGLSHEQCFGSNEQKDSLTELKWEDMPTVNEGTLAGDLQKGKMTAREVMQYVGTGLFRQMSGNVWVDSLLRQIKIEQPEIAIICDCRFPNEVRGIQEAGGKVVRLSRSPYNDDDHESEKALDSKVFPRSNFDSVLNNKYMSLPQQNQAMYQILRKWDYIPELEE